MKLSVVVDDLRRIMADEARRGEAAVTGGIAAAGARLKDAWRGQVTAAGLGRRLASTIRAQTYPAGGRSLNAAALVWTKAPVILGAHDSGATIRSKEGWWLAIPTEAAGRGPRGRRETPGEWQARTGLRLVFIYRAGRPSLLIAEARMSKSGRAVRSRSKTGRGLAAVPIFILVPQVTLKKRLDFAAPARAVIASLPGAIAARWERG